ncbi:hypothetical protein U0N67_002704 [Vibrio parahaemolyticus]|uniref:hypothetical protein n=1 Tax=Vibrio parahaemolyticus TaxID=670 RepID=UPI002AA461B4|nr:hypothetical protein [Vibrio parahaemolyticus]
MAIGINYWIRNSIKNLLEMSISKDFKTACGEWTFTGVVFDYEEPIEICQLCGKDELRYHFEIKNDITDCMLLVGSSCILKFEEIRVANDLGEFETEYSKRDRLLRSALESQRVEQFLGKLRQIYRKPLRSDDRATMGRVGVLIKTREKLSPYDALWLTSIMKRHGYSYDNAPVSICLATNENKEQLIGLPKDFLKDMWPLLSTQQQEKYQRLLK